MAAGAGDTPEANVTLWQGRMAVLSVLSKSDSTCIDRAAPGPAILGVHHP
jgi:hypothetical protein